jgi:hypothetical protein
VKRFAERGKMEVTWYRYNGNPVALLRFPGDQPRPAAQVRQLQLQPCRLRLAGGPAATQQKVAAASAAGDR